MNLVLLSFFVLFAYQRTHSANISVCILQDVSDQCKQLQQISPSVNLECVPARDKTECLHLIQQGKSDIVNLGSNLAYAASAADYNLVPLQEEKTNDGDFMYEGVVVVRKDLQIKTLADLKGKRSCYTGYGRTAGWSIPMALLTAQNIFGETNCGNDLELASGFFSNSCLPGYWSQDPRLDTMLKKKYSNLCELCGEKCNTGTKERYLGYLGALNCLVEQRADVAFTKYVTISEWIGTNESLNDEYQLLCPNGSLVSLSKNCYWAGRSNPLIVINGQTPNDTKQELKQQFMSLVSNAKLRAKQKLLKGILFAYANSSSRDVSMNIKDYLSAGNFTITMDKPLPVKCKESYMQICVTSNTEKEKCQDLKLAAFGSRLRPRFECLQKKDVSECFKAIQDKKADLYIANAYRYYQGVRQFQLQSVVSEVFHKKNFSHYAIAVIKSNSSITKLEDLKGRQACFPSVYSSTGWKIPEATLLQKKLLGQTDVCSIDSKMAAWFGKSCAPGGHEIASSLCDLCKGDENGSNKCNFQDRYMGHKGALQCLEDGVGEVAFVSHTALAEFARTRSSFKASDFSLLCTNDTVAAFNMYETCHWAKLPGRQILANTDLSTSALTNVQLMLVRAGASFTNVSETFKMYSEYQEKDDILFSEYAIGFHTIDTPLPDVLGEDLYNKFELLECVSSANSMLYLSTSLLVCVMVVMINIL